MGKKLSQNREVGKSCSEYSQDTSTQFTIVIDNGVTSKINRGKTQLIGERERANLVVWTGYNY